MKHSISFEKIIPDSEKSHIELLANSYYEGVVCDTIQRNFKGFRHYFYKELLRVQEDPNYDYVQVIPLSEFPGIDVVYDKIDESGAKIVEDFYLKRTDEKPAFQISQNAFKENGLSFSFNSPEDLAKKFVENYLKSIPKKHRDESIYFVDFSSFCWDNNSVDVILSFREFVFSDDKAIDFIKGLAWKK